MDSLHWSGRSPIGVIVIAVFLGLLGLLSLSRLPLQLFPDINRPELSIQTGWRTASPEEVESELLEPLENVLQGMPGVEEIEGNAFAGQAQVNLRFTLGTDMKNALVEVIGRINRLPPLPRDADRPSVSLGGNGNTNETLSWFFVQLLPGTPGPIQEQRRFIEDTVRARLESIPGVAAVQVNAGPPDDVRITLDLARAAALGITIPDVANRAASAPNVSGGQLDVGRRQYTLRFTGRFSPEQLGALVLAWRTLPRLMSLRPHGSSSGTRTATRRSAFRCSGPTAPMCWRRSRRSKPRSRSCAREHSGPTGSVSSSPSTRRCSFAGP